MSQQVPFTILTGYLGAGKTTVLNRLLANAQRRRIAVLVNELGRIAIDSDLILRRGSDVLELAGGCICCSVDLKNDLWDGIIDVIRRSRPDHVVLETTGIAEPQLIVEGLKKLPPEQRRNILLSGIVTVVDAVACVSTLEKHEEARQQIANADRLLLSKLDVASAEAAAKTHDALSAVNNAAERAAFPTTEDGNMALVPWVLSSRPLQTGSTKEKRNHTHQVVAAVFAETFPLLQKPLLQLFAELSPMLLRVKGWVHLANEDRRGFVELAGGKLSLRYGNSWGNETRQTQIVVIGEGLDEGLLRRRLWACRSQ